MPGPLSVEERIAHFEQMTQRFPDQALPWFSLGQVLLEAKRNEEAAAALRRLLTVAPDHTVGHLLLGTALRAIGRLDEATQVLMAGLAVGARRRELPPARRIRKELLSIAREQGLPPPQLPSLDE